MQMLLKQTLYNTKTLFYKTFQNLKSCLLGGFQKLPKNPIFSTKNQQKFQEVDDCCTTSSNQNETPAKMEGQLSPEKEKEKKGQEKINGSLKKADKYSEGKQIGSISQNANALVEKMEELEMMDVKDIDHVLDIEEVLHNYSMLTCKAYQDIVDKFFMDMYAGYNFPPPSTGGSMRKMGPVSVHGSMRKVGSVSVHGSMRSLGPVKR